MSYPINLVWLTKSIIDDRKVRTLGKGDREY